MYTKSNLKITTATLIFDYDYDYEYYDDDDYNYNYKRTTTKTVKTTTTMTTTMTTTLVASHLISNYILSAKSSNQIIRNRAYLGQEKALREQHNLTDLLHVWNNHDHWTEQRLDGLRQFRTSSVTRVHCDENTNTLVHDYLLALELKYK